MVLIHLVETFQSFYDSYQRCSEQQQHQLLAAFAAQVDPETLARFYECWQQFEPSAFEVKPEPMQTVTQAPSKPSHQNKWFYARLSQDGNGTLVKVLSERFNSIRSTIAISVVLNSNSISF